MMGTIEDVRDRLRAEFLEMPGLRLKSEQVQRLCGVERSANWCSIRWWMRSFCA
jgi:hypothetical protein